MMRMVFLKAMTYNFREVIPHVYTFIILPGWTVLCLGQVADTCISLRLFSFGPGMLA